mmetsp:Transcript_39042/g.82111  ORF Transcript_39042/g.82111 Transcript_39042/m.82111 type:complete len:150 (-) Transcript_39042:92-541(-)
MHKDNLIVEFPCRPRGSSPCPSRVSFAEQVEVEIVENLTHKLKAVLWFTPHEMKSFKKFALLQARDMAANWNVEETEAFMGLENLVSRNIRNKVLENRRTYRMAVHCEQRRQLRARLYDPHAMAIVSQSFSAWSRQRARTAGLIHADEI